MAGGPLIVFGGTFDPPHIGHNNAIASAQRFFEKSLGTGMIHVVPAGDPWQKSSARSVTSAAHRFEMASLAFGSMGGVVVSDDEAKRRGPSYMVDTLGRLASDAGVTYGVKSDVILVVGQDVLGGLNSWHRADLLKDAITLGVLRYGARVVGVPDGWDHIGLQAPKVSASSSALRPVLERRDRDPQAMLKITHMLDPSVLEYIEHHGLYLP